MFAHLVPAASRALQLAQQSAERIQLVLVGELLPFGMFHQLQNFLHALQRLFQSGDDLHHFVDGLADGGIRRMRVSRGRRRLVGRNDFPGGPGVRLLRQSGRAGPARAAPASASSSPPPAAARLPGGRGVICSG
jgi:hypothetical protein